MGNLPHPGKFGLLKIVLLAQAAATSLTVKCCYLQYRLCNADMPSLLQAALAEKAFDISRMQASVHKDRQAVLVRVGHFSVPLLLLQTLDADMQLCIAGST